MLTYKAQQQQARADAATSGAHDDHSSASDDHNEWPDYRSSGSSYNQQFQTQGGGSNGKPNDAAAADGYSVASTHDYMGYSREQMSFGDQAGLWDEDDEEKGEEMW